MDYAPETMSAFIDTITFTLPESSSPTGYSVDSDFEKDLTFASLDGFLKPLGLQVGMYCGGGKNFYKHAYWLEYNDANETKPDLPSLSALGFIALGGNNGTACIYFTGFCCAFLNMSRLMPVVRKQLENANGKITRVDTAIDCLNGEYTVDDAVRWWKNGEYKTKGGKPSKYTCHGGWLPGEERERTFEVGSRDSTKFTRIYEKGAQLGDSNSPWVRFEIEWKSKNGALIPYDILENAGTYLRDAYECFSWIPTEENAVESVRYTQKKKIKIDLEHYKKHARTQYGKLISTLSALGFSSQDILQDLSRSGIPDRLIVPASLKNHHILGTQTPF